MYVYIHFCNQIQYVNRSFRTSSKCKWLYYALRVLRTSAFHDDAVKFCFYKKKIKLNISLLQNY